MNAYYMRISQVLTDSVSLSLPPIATTIASQMLEGIRNWTGRVPAGCRFWQGQKRRLRRFRPIMTCAASARSRITWRQLKLTTRTVATR